MIPRIFAALILTATPVFADVTGSYTADGRNPDGSAYNGTVELVQEDGFVSVRWNVAGSTYSGQGPISGDVVTVDWGDTFPVVYVVMPDGELHGTWADGLASEKLTPR